MSKILFVARGKPGLGHVTPALTLAEMASEGGHTCLMASSGNGILFLRRHTRGVPIEALEDDDRAPFIDLLGGFGENSLMPLLLRESPHVVVVLGEPYVPLVCHALGIPSCVVINPNDLRLEGERRNHILLLNELYQYADLIIAPCLPKEYESFSQSLVQRLGARLMRCGILIVPPSQAVPVHDPSLSAPSGATVLTICPGGGVKMSTPALAEGTRQLLECALQAASELQKDIEDFWACIVLPPDQDDRLANRLCRKFSLRRVSVIAGGRLTDYLAISRACLLRSGRIATLEALAYSVPTVAVSVGDPERQFDHEWNCSILAEAGLGIAIRGEDISAQAMIRALRPMLTSPRPRLPAPDSGVADAVQAISRLASLRPDQRV